MTSIRKKVTGLTLIAMFVFGGMGYAQQEQMMQQQQQQQRDYSKEEIDKFADAVVVVLPLQQDAEQKMIEEIEEQGMELQQFNQIAQQLQSGSEPQGVTEDQMETFQSISEEIQSIQQEVQQKINKAITDSGISPALYQEMIGAYQTNPEIKETVDKKLAEEEENQ